MDGRDGQPAGPAKEPAMSDGPVTATPPVRVPAPAIPAGITETASGQAHQQMTPALAGVG